MDRWNRWGGTSARVTESGHTGARTAYSCAHARGKTAQPPSSPAPGEPRGDPPAGRRRRDAGREPVLVGRRGRRLLRRARRLPRRQRLRLGAGGLDRGGARPARGARRDDRARDRRRRRASARAGWRATPTCGSSPATCRWGCCAPPAGSRAGLAGCRRHGIRPAPPPPVRRPGAAPRRRDRRPGVHGVRRRAVRRGQRCRRAGGGPGAAPRWPVRVLDVAPGAVGLPRRPGSERPHGDDVVLRPHALRRERGGGRDVRRAPPHPRGPRAAGRRGRARPRRPRRAGVAGAHHAGVGRLVTPARPAAPAAASFWAAPPPLAGLVLFSPRPPPDDTAGGWRPPPWPSKGGRPSGAAGGPPPPPAPTPAPVAAPRPRWRGFGCRRPRYRWGIRGGAGPPGGGPIPCPRPGAPWPLA